MLASGYQGYEDIWEPALLVRVGFNLNTYKLSPVPNMLMC